MNAPRIYRDATSADAGTIAAFQVQMAAETEGLNLDPETCARGVRAIFEDPSRGRYFVAEHDGRVVGSLLITYEWSDWRASTVWWIQSVFIDGTMRRQGVYRGLWDHVRALASGDPGVAGIRLYVDRRNTAAQQTYHSLGMNGDHYTTFEWMKDF